MSEVDWLFNSKRQLELRISMAEFCFFIIFLIRACECDFYNRNSEELHDFKTSNCEFFFKIDGWNIFCPAHPSWWNNMSWRCEFVYIFVNPAEERHVPHPCRKWVIIPPGIDWNNNYIVVYIAIVLLCLRVYFIVNELVDNK